MRARLEDLAHEVSVLGARRVADASGVRPARVSRFVNNPLALTARDVERVTTAVRQLAPREE